MLTTPRHTWTVLHGLIAGGLLLVTFSGVLVQLLNLRREWLNEEGVRTGLQRLTALVWVFLVATYVSVSLGSFLVYPWYRAHPPARADLRDYPRSYLLSNPQTTPWHTIGMEWKEHIGWLGVFYVTAAASLVRRCGTKIAEDAPLRITLIALMLLTFLPAVVSGVLGTLITKAAPVQ